MKMDHTANCPHRQDSSLMLIANFFYYCRKSV